MLEPKGYNKVQEFGEYEKLAPGGHVLRILKVEETTSRNGDDMIKIYLDTDKTDKQPGFFKKRYDSDTRANKKWGCIVNQLVIDTKTGLASRGLKTFHTCVEKSNSSSFKLIWGDKYAANFKNKLIGGLFRNEEYENRTAQQAGRSSAWLFIRSERFLKGLKCLKTSTLTMRLHPAIPLQTVLLPLRRQTIFRYPMTTTIRSDRGAYDRRV